MNDNEKLEYYKKKYIGVKGINSVGESMIIIDYISGHNIVVEFQDGTKVNCSVNNFKKGRVKNYNSPSVFGIGIPGNICPITSNNKSTKEYIAWRGMLERCYHNKGDVRNQSYLKCTVDEPWLYYPNFYEWITNQENYSKWKYGKYMIDKDILVKHNTIYSHDRCTLVPYHINMLLTKHDAKRGEYPIGVFYNKLNKCFDIQVSDGILTGKRSIHKSGFGSPESAFAEYKELKEKIIKLRAYDEYSKGNITEECYYALMNYEVEITD